MTGLQAKYWSNILYLCTRAGKCIRAQIVRINVYITYADVVQFSSNAVNVAVIALPRDAAASRTKPLSAHCCLQLCILIPFHLF